LLRKSYIQTSKSPSSPHTALTPSKGGNPDQTVIQSGGTQDDREQSRTMAGPPINKFYGDNFGAHWQKSVLMPRPLAAAKLIPHQPTLLRQSLMPQRLLRQTLENFLLSSRAKFLPVTVQWQTGRISGALHGSDAGPSGVARSRTSTPLRTSPASVPLISRLRSDDFAMKMTASLAVPQASAPHEMGTIDQHGPKTQPSPLQTARSQRRGGGSGTYSNSRLTNFLAGAQPTTASRSDMFKNETASPSIEHTTLSENRQAARVRRKDEEALLEAKEHSAPPDHLPAHGHESVMTKIADPRIAEPLGRSQILTIRHGGTVAQRPPAAPSRAPKYEAPAATVLPLANTATSRIESTSTRQLAVSREPSSLTPQGEIGGTPGHGRHDLSGVIWQAPLRHWVARAGNVGRLFLAVTHYRIVASMA
jgi:hypothetical protein